MSNTDYTKKIKQALDLTNELLNFAVFLDTEKRKTVGGVDFLTFHLEVLKELIEEISNETKKTDQK